MGTNYVGRVQELIQGDALARALLAVGVSALQTPVFLSDQLPDDVAAVQSSLPSNPMRPVIFYNAFVYQDPENTAFTLAHELIHVRQTMLGRPYNPSNLPYASIPAERTANRGAAYIVDYAKPDYGGIALRIGGNTQLIASLLQP